MLIKYKPGQRYIQEKFCRCGQNHPQYFKKYCCKLQTTTQPANEYRGGDFKREHA